MPHPPIQAKLITNRSNISYLSGFTGSAGFMLLTKNKDYLFTDSRYIERAKNTIKKGIEIIDVTRVWRNPEELKKSWQKILKKHRVKVLGVEEDDLTVAKFKKFKKISKSKNGKIKFTDTSGEIENKRETKTEKEIQLIKKSQRINEKVFAEIKKIVQVLQGRSSTISEMDLAWKIKELAHKHGADDIAFDPIVAFGKNSAIPHHQPGKTRLKKQDVTLIDMGVKYKGYCSDMTRTILPRKPSPQQKEIYNIVLTAQKEAIKKIRAGITGKRADSYSRSIIEKAGYGDYYEHAGGHGIGIDIHESPSLSENYTKKLKKNSVITIEPGIYIPGKFGVRIEDMVIVTEKGTTNLTKTIK